MDKEDSTVPDEALAPDEQAEDQGTETRVETDSVELTVCPECSCEIDVQGIDSFSEVECPDCSARVTVPAKLGPFLLTNMLGAGGMGAVYIAKDEALGRQVAIKVMLKSLGEDPEFIAAFKREAQAAAKINHPNICQIYSFGTEKGQPYIVMELIKGERFDALVESGRKLDQGLVMQVGHDIAQGLAAAYEEDLLHGDIKPENILLDEKLRAKLVDFGIASVAGQASEGIWGTPYYIAPEKILRQKPDGRSDMYSLGATLFHALAGKPPFEGETPVDVVKARLNEDAPDIKSIRPDLKPEVVQVISRMLQKSPGMRHPTYASLVSDLGKCVTACGGRKKSLAKLKKTGRIMITKKSKTATVKSAPSPDSTQKKMPKIRVPKRSIVMPSAATRTTATGSATAVQSRPPAPKKPPSKAPLVIFLILLAAAVVGGGAWYLYDKKKKDRAIKVEYIRYTNAMSDMSKELGNVSNIVESVTKIVNASTDYPEKAKKAVKVITGQELVVKKKAAAPAASPPAKAAEKKTPPAAASQTAPPRAAPKKVVDEMGREAPAGIGEPEAPAAQPKTAAAPAPAPVETKPASKDDPKVVQLAKKLIEDCDELQGQMEDIAAKQTEANLAYDEGKTSGTSFVALNSLATITNIVNDLTEMKKEAKVVFDRATMNMEEADGLRQAFEKAELEKKLAAEKAERERLAALDAQHKEEERLARISEEKSTIDTAHTDALDLYKENKYAEGLTLITNLVASTTTDEAKPILEDYIEEGKLLVEMKKYLADQITAEPYRWGWLLDGQPVDVVKATPDEIITRTRKATWQEANVKQMMHFFRNYMKKDTVPLKKLARMNLAAAIYCRINGGESYAKDFAGTADGFDPNIFKLRERVFPPKEEE